MVTVFEDDDTGYLKWLKMNPEGYVLNTTRPPSTDYLKLHAATCPFIRGIHGTPPRGSSWTGSYIKVCAPTRWELEQWLQKQFGSAGKKSMTDCGHEK